MTKFRWRMLFGILAIIAIAAVAAACGDDDDDSTGNTPAATTAPGTTPAATTAATASNAAPSGTITIQAQQFQTWDPHISNFAQDIAQFFMVWRGLYEFDLNSKPVPS